MTNAFNDELISSLDYKMRTSNASYVIARKDVQFFPSSLSTEIPLTTGGDWLDSDSIKIAFRFVNNDATNDFNPMGHPACLIKRIQLFANGQRTDDIDNYARSVHLYSLLKPREWWINQANEGFEINKVSNFPQPLPEGHFQEVLMAPTRRAPELRQEASTTAQSCVGDRVGRSSGCGARWHQQLHGL